MADAVRNRRIDRVFRDVPFNPCVILSVRVIKQRTTLLFHFVGGLPCAQNHFPHTPHRLAVARHHANGSEVMQDVFGSNRLLADSAFSESQVLGNRGVEVMTDH